MSSYFSQVDSKITRAVVLKNPEGGDIDISCSTGNIKINGIVPTNGGGGVGILPPDIDGTGNITTQGNITATGDGISNGKIVGQTITSTDNIVITAGSLEVTTGGVDIKGNGNLSLEGNGDINVLGTGNIGVGIGGITSSGDIETSSGDIVSAGDFIFEGDDIKHRTNNPVAVQSYVQYKQLPQLNANNTFTGTNKFNDNVTEFAEKVSVGTRDAQGLFTQTIALNKSGNIESQTIQNVTSIQTGTLNCGNGGVNSCAAKTFTTRTSGLAGWSIEQQTAQGDALDNVLQIKGGQAGAYVSIIDSAFSGFVPNITLDPRTTALGGQVQTNEFRVGDGANAFDITQPKSGADSNNLLIKAGAANTPIKFQNNAGTTDLVRIEPDGTDGSGRIYCPAIYFGTTGLHNSIVNDVAGPESLVMKIRQATASSEVVFLDNADAEIIRIQKTQIEFGQNIPILFNNFSFRPQQYTFNFTGALIDDNPAGVLFNSHNALWTNVNDGGPTQTLATIGNNFYKMTIIGVPDNSAGVYGNFRWSGDFPFMIPNFSPAIVPQRYNGNFCIADSPANFTKPDLCGYSSGSTDYKLCFPSVAAGTETYTGIIRITILNT